MTTLSAFAVLLSRYTGQDDLAVGSDVANRSSREMEGVVGFFVNQVVIRADLSGDPSFVELLSRIRRITLDAVRNGEVPFDRTVEELAPKDRTDRAPLFSVKLVADNDALSSLKVGELVMEREPVSAGISKLDLTVFISDGQRGIQVVFEYSDELFDRERIELMARDFEALLDQFSSHPELPISAVNLPSALTQSEAAELFRDAALQQIAATLA
jgi:non-ribosomal peptide synthetase component F